MREETRKWKIRFYISIVVLSIILGVAISKELRNQKRTKEYEQNYVISFQTGVDTQRKLNEAILKFSYEQETDTLEQLSKLGNSLKDVKTVSDAEDKIQEINKVIEEKEKELKRNNNNKDNTEKETLFPETN